MKILFLEWNSYCNEDMIETMKDLDIEVTKIPFPNIKMTEAEVRTILAGIHDIKQYDFLFSFNYFPAVSISCNDLDMKYIAWIYDSPYIHAYSYTIINECNYIFIFDYAMYEELSNAGISTVYYLPLGINDKRLSSIKNTQDMIAKYSNQISFVGSMYSEEKHRLYDKFNSISQYAKGYLDGLIQAQLRVYGYNFLKDMLNEEVLIEMQKAYPTDPNAYTVLSPESIYADYVLSREVTAIDRKQTLSLLGEKYPVALYTNDKSLKINGVRNKGPVDYYNIMPYVFINTKINLNITLRSIKTGIPLRAIDIMGCGGFLLTNYQEEFLSYFESDEDFVYYTDYEDLLDKAKFYLEHDDIRQRIAENGCRKTRTYHTLKSRTETILEVIRG